MSQQDAIEQRVIKVVSGRLNVPSEKVVTAASFVDDLGADSLDLVELITDLEEEFAAEIGGEICDNDSAKFQTVGLVIEYIRAKSLSGEGPLLAKSPECRAAHSYSRVAVHPDRGAVE